MTWPWSVTSSTWSLGGVTAALPGISARSWRTYGNLRLALLKTLWWMDWGSCCAAQILAVPRVIHNGYICPRCQNCRSPCKSSAESLPGGTGVSQFIYEELLVRIEWTHFNRNYMSHEGDIWGLIWYASKRSEFWHPGVNRLKEPSLPIILGYEIYVERICNSGSLLRSKAYIYTALGDFDKESFPHLW